MIDIVQRQMRVKSHAIPNGAYEFEDAIQDDGLTDRSHQMRLRLEVLDEEVGTNLTAFAPQAVSGVSDRGLRASGGIGGTLGTSRDAQRRAAADRDQRGDGRCMEEGSVDHRAGAG